MTDSGNEGVGATGPPRWLVASGLGLTQVIAFGTSLYLLTVLAQPIADDTGWPLEWIVGGFSIGALSAAVISPRVGRSVRQQGGKPALALSAMMFAAGLSILAAAPNLPIYVAGWVVMGLGMGSGLYDTVFGTLGRLYGLEARRAITIVTLWGGFASTTFWPLSGLLVTTVGWRWTCAVFALTHLLISLPIFLKLLPDAEPAGGAGAPSAAQAPHTPLRRARTALVVLALVLMAETLVASIMSVHLITILRERGVSLAAAVALGAFVGPAQVSARFGESLFGARIHPSLTMLVAVGCIATGALGLSVAPTVIVPLVLMTYGAGIGLVSIARGTLPLYLFGGYEAPAVLGRLARPIAVTQALAPFLGAVMITRLGGQQTLWVLAGVGLFSVLAAVYLRRLSRHDAP